MLNESMITPLTDQMTSVMLGPMTQGAVVMAIDTAMVTVGSALLGGTNNYYGYDFGFFPFGTVDPSTLTFKGGVTAPIDGAFYGQISEIVKLEVQYEGVGLENTSASAFDTLAITDGSSDIMVLNRGEATYSVDSDIHAWIWTVESNPFGTTNNAIRVLELRG